MKNEEIQKKFIGVIVERQFLSDEKLLYILDYAASGLPMRDSNGNRFFRTNKGKKYFYADDYKHCLDGEKFYCAWYDEESNIKDLIAKEWNIKIDDTDDLVEVVSDVMYDNVFVANINYEEENIKILQGVLPRTKEEVKEMQQKILEKYQDINQNTFLPATVKSKNKDSNIKSLIQVKLQDIEDCNDYDELLKIKKDIEKEYHDRNVLNAYIKYKEGNAKLLPYFEEEFVNSNKVKELIQALKNKTIDKNDLSMYYDANANLLELMNNHIKKIDDKIMYGKETEEQRKEREKELEYIFTTIYNVKNSDKIYNEMLKTVISQDDAVKRLITEINKFSLLDNPSNKKGVLLTGSTGVGKTLMINTLSKLLNKPVCVIDSSQLVINGYKGTHIDEYLETCLASLNYDVEALENAIIYFDEIDKKGMNTDSDVSGKGVLDSLLKFLDGTVYDIEVDAGIGRKHYRVKTDNMFVIAGGSFNSVYGRTAKRGIGFKADLNPKLEITDEDFMTYGRMTKEFMGRFPIVIHLNDLEEKDYKKILLESEKSPLKIEEDLFRKLGVKLDTTNQFLNEVSKKASENGKGARGLMGIISNCTSEAFAYATDNYGEVDTIKLTKKTLEDNKNFTVVKTKRLH